MNWRDFLLLAGRLATGTTEAAAVQVGDRILQVLDAAGQEPTRTRIKDAMIVYERDVLHDVSWRP
jgi:hypothetical protein